MQTPVSEFYFEIPGPIKGKARPRVTRSGVTYTPRDTVMYENLVRAIYDGPEPLPNCRYHVYITAYFEVPKSTPKKKLRLIGEGLIAPTKKPDWDNIGKIICDSLNGIAWPDDSCVTEATVRKAYAVNAPHVSVQIYAYDNTGKEVRHEDNS